MLSARAYSFHQKSKLAISLSWIGGYTNVVSLLSTGWVASHMSGPTTWVGVVLVEGEAGVRLLRVSQRHPTVLRLVLLASIFGSFLLGAVAGAYVFLHGRTLAMLIPIAFLCSIVFMDWWRPISDVRELDLLSDPELKVYGI